MKTILTTVTLLLTIGLGICHTQVSSQNDTTRTIEPVPERPIGPGREQNIF